MSRVREANNNQDRQNSMHAMQPKPKPSLDILTTNQLLARIKQDFGLEYDRKAVIAWVNRKEKPLPVKYVGGRGQSHKYDYKVFLAWFKKENSQTVRDVASIKADASQLDTADFHLARTIDMRERAKRSIVETGVITGKFCETAKVELEAEDLGRQAVQALLNISPRVSPRLAVMTDELEIDKLLQQELRAVCKQIMDLAAGEEPTEEILAE